MFKTPDTLGQLLRDRAAEQDGALAYGLLDDQADLRDTLTYGDLHRAASRLAVTLARRFAPGARLLVAYPNGLEFLVAFFACVLSGRIAVPVAAPKRNRANERFKSIVKDAQPAGVLTPAAWHDLLAAETRGAGFRVSVCATEGGAPAAVDGVGDAAADARRGDTEPGGARDEARDGASAASAAAWDAAPDSVAYLQYTSGSIAAPKGVIVTHANVIANSSIARFVEENDADTVSLTWLPNFHDMGLVEGLLQPLFSGVPGLILTPAAFLQRPRLWLEAITRHRVTNSGAPNFAYQLCADKAADDAGPPLDLASWRVAYNGAEPIQDETLRAFLARFGPCGFQEQAFYPVYGLAEATLVVTSGRRRDLPFRLRVSRARLEQGVAEPVPASAPASAATLEVSAVSSDTGPHDRRDASESRDERGARDAHDSRGERTLVASGTVMTEPRDLRTEVAIVDPATGEPRPDGTIGEVWLAGPSIAAGYWSRPHETRETFRARISGRAQWFARTGDLGFVFGGALFLTGRLKDLIITKGRNLYPHDLEWLAGTAHPRVQPWACAAFAAGSDGTGDDARGGAGTGDRDGGDEDRIVLVCEAERTMTPDEMQAAAAVIGERVSTELEIEIHDVLFIRAATLPKTTSGKVRRPACRELWRTGGLQVLYSRRQAEAVAAAAVDGVALAVAGDGATRELKSAAKSGAEDAVAGGGATRAATTPMPSSIPSASPSPSPSPSPSHSPLLLSPSSSSSSSSSSSARTDLAADVRAYLRAQLRRARDLAPVDDVILRELVNDSLKAVKICHALERRFGAHVPMSWLMDGSTLSALADRLAARLATETAVRSASGADAGVDPGANAIANVIANAGANVRQTTVAAAMDEPRFARDGEAATSAAPIVDDAEPIPLSYGQEALRALSALAPSSVAYHLCRLLDIDGPLDTDTLRRALDLLIARHAALRTRFQTIDGRPRQTFDSSHTVEWTVEDATQVSPDALRVRLDERAWQPFDLNGGEDAADRAATGARGIHTASRADDRAAPVSDTHTPRVSRALLRLHLFKCAADRHLLLIAVSHSIADLASIAQLLDELLAHYEALAAGRWLPAVPAPGHYAAVVRWQRGLRGSAEGEMLRGRWRAHLAGLPAETALPLDRPRPPAQTFDGATLAHDLDASVTRAIDGAARAAGTTPFCVMLAAYCLFLHRTTGQRTISVGVPVAGRSSAAFADTVGLLANSIVIVSTLDPRTTWRELVARTHAQVVAALDTGAYPFALLAEDAGIRRDPRLSPLFQQMFSLEAPTRADLLAPLVVSRDGPWTGSGALRLRPAAFTQRGAQFDLQARFVRHDERLLGAWTFNTELFDAATVAAWAAAYAHLLRTALDDPDRAAVMIPAPAMEPAGVGASDGADTAADAATDTAADTATTTDRTADTAADVAAAIDRMRPPPGLNRRSLTRDRLNEPTLNAPGLDRPGLDGPRLDMPDAGLHELIAAQARRTPDRVAVSSAEGQTTYAQLARDAAHIARALRQRGIGPEDRVGVCLDRCLSLPAVLLGIVCAGASYVPLATDLPPARVAQLLADASPVLVVTQTSHAAIAGPRALSIDELLPAPSALPTPSAPTAPSALPSLSASPTSPASSAAPTPSARSARTSSSAAPPASTPADRAAYVIFTSGSTGRPKGAINTHGAIVNRLLWMQHAYPIGADDCVLQKTPYAFDVSVWEFFWPLLAGARLAICPPGLHRDPLALARVIAGDAVTVLHFVPSMLGAFIPQADPRDVASVRLLFCSGEVLSRPLEAQALRLFPGAVHNLYGPTEAAVDVTAWHCRTDDGGATVPIGAPIANITIRLLDAWGRPALPGVPGELSIGGTGLARGYIARPDLTAASFVPDPCATIPGARLYRTGDRARVIVDGSGTARDGAIEFLGRRDFQVKLRGFRVELPEIEAQMEAHPAITAAAVVAREHESTGLRLIGYYTTRGAASPVVRAESIAASAIATAAVSRVASADAVAETPGGTAVDTPADAKADASPDAVRRWLAARLPEYMVPAQLVPIAALPRLDSGKIDRRTLSRLDTPAAADTVAPVPPRTPAERVLADTWQALLGLSSISVTDSFFERGGDSLLIVRAVVDARARGLEITAEQIYRWQTIDRICANLPASASLAAPASERSPALSPPAALRVSPSPPQAETGTALAVPALAGAAVGSEPYRPFSLVDPEDLSRLPSGLEDALPLGRLQEGLIYHIESSANYIAYVVSVHLRAPFRQDVWEEVLDAAIERHPYLRVSFQRAGLTQPLQAFHKSIARPLFVEDLRGLAPEAQQTHLAGWIAAEKKRRFAWDVPPLFRLTLHRRSEATFQLSLTEVSLDGWSIAVLLSALCRDYSRLLREEPLQWEDPDARPPVHGPFARLEQRAAASAESAAFWQRMSSVEGTAALPLWPVSTRSDDATLHCRRTVAIAGPIGARLRARAVGEKVSLKSVCLAAHLAVLRTLTGREELITALITHGRPDIEGADRAIGLFTNTVPLRATLRHATWRDGVRRAHDAEAELYPHRRYPFADIFKASRSPLLLQSAFNYTHFHVYRDLLRAGGGPLDVLDVQASDQTYFHLTAYFNVAPGDHGLSIDLDYDPTRLAHAQVAQIAGYYERALHAIAETPDVPIASVSLLSAEEVSRELHEWSGVAMPQPSAAASGIEEAPATRTTTGTDSVGAVARATGTTTTTTTTTITTTATATTARDTAIDATPDVMAVIARRWQSSPDRIAVTQSGASLSYGELRRQAAAWHARLAARGIGLEDAVGLLADRSIDTICAWLGALRAGACVVPLDPCDPPARRAAITREAGLRAVIAADSADAASASGGSSRRVPAQVPTTALAYCIYTSGSTGQPKGVDVPRGALSSFIASAADAYGFTMDDRVLQFASLSFDTAIEEIFGTLCTGATLVLRSAQALESFDEFLRELATEAITLVDLPTAFWHELTAAIAARRLAWPAAARTVILGGERALAGRLADWRAGVGAGTAAGVAIHNSYGPTEATVVALQQRVDGAELADDDVPIGRPLGGATAFVMDVDGGVGPVGRPGELWLGGRGLARGYRARPAQTADRFRPHPHGRAAGERLYRTGDLATRGPDGVLTFAGRVDEQVKIRGFRVEPAEVAAALEADERVREAVVIALPADYDDAPSALAAFVVPTFDTVADSQPAASSPVTPAVPAPSVTPAASVSSVTLQPAQAESAGALAQALLARLRAVLPAYMVPSQITIRQTLPRTRTGKIDKAALRASAASAASAAPAARASAVSTGSTSPAPATTASTVAPAAAAAAATATAAAGVAVAVSSTAADSPAAGVTTATVTATTTGTAATAQPLDAVIRATLAVSLRLDDVPRGRSFLEAGGDSLSAMRIVSRVQERLGVTLGVRDIFAAPTLDALVDRIVRLRAAAAALPPAPDLLPPRAAPDQPLEMSYAQERLWFLHQFDPRSTSYNVPAAFELRGPLNVAALQQAMQEICRRHQVLQMRFEDGPDGPLPIRPARFAVPFAQIDLRSACSDGPCAAPPRAAALAIAAREAARGFDLQRGPLVRVTLIREQPDASLLVIVMHHIVTDEWCAEIFFDELQQLYQAAVRGTPPALAELPLQYADFARWQKTAVSGARLDALQAFWHRQLDGAPPLLPLPLDVPRAQAGRNHGARHAFDLDPAVSAALRALARRHDASPFMVMLSIYQILLRTISGADDVVLGSPVAGRALPAFERLIGFFANLMVLRSPVRDGSTFVAHLAAVRARALACYDHQELSFAQLVASLNPERNAAYAPIVQVIFGLWPQPREQAVMAGLRLRRLPLFQQQAKYDLEMQIADRGDALSGFLEYNAALFSPATIAALVRTYQRLCGEVAAHPEASLLEIRQRAAEAPLVAAS